MASVDTIKNSLSADALAYFKCHSQIPNSEVVPDILELLAKVRKIGDTNEYNFRSFLTLDSDINSFVNETARYVYFILYDLVENRQTLTFPLERYDTMVLLMTFFEAAHEIHILRELDLLETNTNVSYMLYAMFLVKNKLYLLPDDSKKVLESLFCYYCGLANQPLYLNFSDFDDIVEISLI